MRPDRIVVGECRAGEALDMIQAMTTGHEGSLSTGHANTPPDMLRRLETMILMTGYDLPMRIPTGADPQKLVELMGRDKKSLGDGLTFVLAGPDGLEVVPAVEPAVAAAALDAVT